MISAMKAVVVLDWRVLSDGSIPLCILPLVTRRFAHVVCAANVFRLLDGGTLRFLVCAEGNAELV